MPTAKARPGRPASIAPSEKAAPVPTRPQGSEPVRTPSITVFISVACGAGSCSEPNVNAWPRMSTVPAIAQQAHAAPITWPSCWRAGVAPTRKPVFRSCAMSPALLAAIATIVPTVSTPARVDPARGPEDRGRPEQRDERDPGGRLRRDADDPDDARRDRHEHHAEDADPDREHRALHGRHPAGEDAGDEPRD